MIQFVSRSKYAMFGYKKLLFKGVYINRRFRLLEAKKIMYSADRTQEFETLNQVVYMK